MPPPTLPLLLYSCKWAGLKGAAPPLLEMELLLLNLDPLKFDLHLQPLKKINSDLLMAELGDLLTVLNFPNPMQHL